MKKIALIFIVLSVLALYGCQKSSTPAPIKNQPTEVNVPYSKGPSGPPNVKGPTAPPPNSAINQNQPQAVTNNENIKLTLPLQNS